MLMEGLDAGENGGGSQKKDGCGAGGLSARRERKKSKYLSSPYTNLGRFALKEKPADWPKELPLPPHSAAKKEDEKKKVSPPQDNVGAREVLLLVRSFGKDIFHKRHFPKAAEGFLGLLRSSDFAEGADHNSYREHKCPAAENALAKASADATGVVSDSCASQKKQVEGVPKLKRSRKKKDQDGTGGSSIKRKKLEKTSPKATIPIKQLSAEDIISQVKSGGGAGMGVGVPDHKNRLVFRSPFSVAMSRGIKPGVGIGIRVDMNVQSGIVDAPVTSVQIEAMKLEANIPVDTNEQGAVTDVPATSGLLPTHGGISQPADGNKDNASVPRLGLADMRKNLESMISSLKSGRSPLTTAGAKPAPENLLGEMQQLLSKLDKMQPGPSSSAGTP